MDIEQFVKENGIAVFAETNLLTGEVRTWKGDAPMENTGLYNQLVVYANASDMKDFLQGQILPQTWRQGSTRAVLCLPREDTMVTLFLDYEGDAVSFYDRAKKIDGIVSRIYKGQN